MTDKQKRKYKSRAEYINTQKAIVMIAQQKIAKGEVLTEEENNSYQQAITILQEKGLLADQLTATNNKTNYDVELLNIASTKPEAIKWLWTNYLAKGKVHILSGMAGTGKTTLAISLAAIISTGGCFPDGQPCKTKGNILIWSAEDDINDTLSPRIIAAGADQYSVFCIKCKVDPITLEKIPFDISQDIPLLYKQVKDIGGIDLFIIDPIVSAVKKDMHKANDVRHALQPLVDFAQKANCAVLGITHFSKNTNGKNPLERVTGSQAFGALARIVLVAAKEQDGHSRVLAIAKSNIGQDNGGIHYQLEQVPIANGINASRVQWGEVLTGNATDILNDLEQPEGDQRENNEPSEVLKELLVHGKMLLDDVKQVMKKNGFTEKQIRTAREKIGVQSVREGFSRDMKTFLELPQFCPNPPVMPTIFMGKTDKKGQNWTANPHKNTPAINQNNDDIKNKDYENVTCNQPKNTSDINQNLIHQSTIEEDDFYNTLTKKEQIQLTKIAIETLKLDDNYLLIEWSIITFDNYHNLLNHDLQLAISSILESSHAQQQLNRYYYDNDINLKVTEQGELIARVDLSDDQVAI